MQLSYNSRLSRSTVEYTYADMLQFVPMIRGALQCHYVHLGDLLIHAANAASARCIFGRSTTLPRIIPADGRKSEVVNKSTLVSPNTSFFCLTLSTSFYRCDDSPIDRKHRSQPPNQTPHNRVDMATSNPKIPFSDPPYLMGLPSAYYKPTHLRWQKACRAFIEEHLLPQAMEWEREETVPEHVFETFAKHNMLIPNLPAPLPVEWLKKLGIHDILGVVKVEEWDYFHTGIYADEVRTLRSTLANSMIVIADALSVVDGTDWSRRPVRFIDNRIRVRYPTPH